MRTVRPCLEVPSLCIIHHVDVREKALKWEFETQITPRLHLFLKKKLAYKNVTSMLGPVFNHDTLHLISIVICFLFVVNADVNQTIGTLLNLLSVRSG